MLPQSLQAPETMNVPQKFHIEDATIQGVRMALSHPREWVPGLVHALRTAQSPVGAAPLAAALWFSMLCALWAYVRSNITGSTSQVDMMWSLLPPAYVTWFAALAFYTSGASPRLAVMTALALAWSIRMTYNFARKGGYSGVEDYRWPVLRRRISNPILWQLFNIGFVSIYQNLLLLSLALPAWAVFLRSQSAWTAVDTAALSMFLMFLLLETVADEQQWRFQCRKHALTLVQRAQHPNPDIRRGFLTSGLFRFSRHPNFFAEQGMWWAFYLFAVGAVLGEQKNPAWWRVIFQGSAVPFFHWSIIGPVQLTLLFQGSTWLTEQLSLEKYGDLYRAYQRRTSRLIPMWAPALLKEHRA